MQIGRQPRRIPMTKNDEAHAGLFPDSSRSIRAALRWILSLLSAACSFQVLGGDIQIPDANFKAFLLSHYDANGDLEISEQEAAAVTGLLNCSYQNIAELTGIESFVNIEQLYCYGNELTGLPDLTALTNLRTLDCNNNRIHELPHLCGMTALEHLIVYNNFLEDPPLVDRLPNLVELTCNGNNFDPCDCPAVELIHRKGLSTFVTNPQRDGSTLSCVPNPIICFPDPDFEQELINLGLDTSGDFLISLDEAQALSGNLFLSEKGLHDLAGLEFFSNVTFADLSRNTVSNLPPLCRLTSLNTLSAYSMDLMSLPPISCLPNLRTLRVADNQLTTLPELPTALSLRTLDCSENDLTELPSLTDQHDLFEFYCVRNRITHLGELPVPSSLKYLWINDNQISSLPALEDQTQLLNLDCSFNRLHQLPDLPNPSNLMELDGSHNYLTSLPDLGSQLKLTDLSLQYNQLTEVADFSGFPDLSDINLAHNNLQSAPQFFDLPWILSLVLSHNQLDALPELTDIPSLRWLLVDHNKITQLPADWSNLLLLRTLDLHDNRIEQLPDLSPLVSLEDLLCSSNRLTVAPEIRIPMNQVDLQGNLLDEGQCPVLLENTPYVVSYTYSPQGGFFLLDDELPQWPGPPSPLFEWISAITAHSFQVPLTCQ